MDIDVSVILPTYNRADTLLPACQSVLSQVNTRLELIVVDDASTDDIRAVVDQLADDRVRYVRRSENGGASAARNTGLELARGPFIAFQDSDDLWLPSKLERQLALFSNLPADVGAVFGTKILYGRDDRWRYGEGRVTLMPPPHGRLRLDEDQTKRFLFSNRISLQNALFRRTCMGSSIRWFDPCAKANADWEFTSRLAQSTRIYEDPEPVVLAFISGDSISKRPHKKILGMLRILKKNAYVLDRYPDAKAQLLLKIGTALAGMGKSKLALSFLFTAIRLDPISLRSSARLVKKVVAQRVRGRPHASLTRTVQTRAVGAAGQ